MILEMASRTRGECRWPWMTLDTSGVETPSILAKSPTLSLFSANRRRISLLFMVPFYSERIIFYKRKNAKEAKNAEGRFTGALENAPNGSNS